MKQLLLFAALLLSITLNAQNPDARIVKIQFTTGNFISVHTFPGTPDSINNSNSFLQTFMNEGAPFITTNTYDSSTTGPFTYNQKWMFVAYPPLTETSEDITVNGFIDAEYYQDSILYPIDWVLQLEDQVDAYYRRYTTDPWINLDSIEAELEADPTYLGPIFNSAIDTLDPDNDGYVFSYQIKLTYQSVQDTVANSVEHLAIKKVKVNTYADHYLLKSPFDDYTVQLYSIEGKLLFTDKFRGESYSLDSRMLKTGIYIYTLKGESNSFSGKPYKQ